MEGKVVRSSHNHRPESLFVGGDVAIADAVILVASILPLEKVAPDSAFLIRFIVRVAEDSGELRLGICARYISVWSLPASPGWRDFSPACS